MVYKALSAAGVLKEERRAQVFGAQCWCARLTLLCSWYPSITLSAGGQAALLARGLPQQQPQQQPGGFTHQAGPQPNKGSGRRRRRQQRRRRAARPQPQPADAEPGGGQGGGAPQPPSAHLGARLVPGGLTCCYSATWVGRFACPVSGGAGMAILVEPTQPHSRFLIVQACPALACPLLLQGKLVNETRCLQCETGARCPSNFRGMLLLWTDAVLRAAS